jgi:hypothetical protein
MNPPSRSRSTSHYELRIQGHLDQHWSSWFGGLTLQNEDDGTTTLRGPVIDQAELHGLLAKVRDLGATLISIRTIDNPDHDDGRFPDRLAMSTCPASSERRRGRTSGDL